MEKKCNKCGKVKDITEFAKDAHTFDGKQCYCRDCIHKRAHYYATLRKEGRNVTLARFTTQELLKEISLRLK